MYLYNLKFIWFTSLNLKNINENMEDLKKSPIIQLTRY